ncbi:MAG: hypothetical protein ACN2B6_11460 [Rickettsiales bacterium]
MTEIALIDKIASFRHDPYGFVLYAFPWGEEGTPLHDEAGPRQWQKDILIEIGDKLKAGGEAGCVIREAVASGHGIGKSALVAWINLWGISTLPETKGVCTANTEPQLRTKTWPELAKWFNMMICKDWFKLVGTTLYQRQREKTWRIDAIPWSANNTEAFAGLHNKKRRIILVFDEASAIDDCIWEVSEGALTDEETEIIWIAFGNPTRNTGRFRECFRRERKRWSNRQIDSRKVEGTNKEQIQEWEEDRGADSDFFKIRVRGEFPSQSVRQFISDEDVQPARGRLLQPAQFAFAPKIISCDPAWEGDDTLVIGLRQGLSFRILKKVDKNDNDIVIANMIARFEDEERASAVFIDGGYGTGIVSAGRTLRRKWQIVWFSAKPDDEGYLNKRAEMWGQMREWLKEGGSIPEHDNDLYYDLISPETVPRMDGKIQLEGKEAMKKRGLPSPNCGDALALTFAYPVSARGGKMARANSKRRKRY